MPLSPSRGNNHNNNNSIFKSLSPALQKRLEQRRKTLDDQPAGEVMNDEVRDEPGVGGVKSAMQSIKATAPPQLLYHSSRMNGWEDHGDDADEEKKQDDINHDVSISIKDRLRAYTSTTTPRQVATYRERPPLIDIYAGSCCPSEIPSGGPSTSVSTAAAESPTSPIVSSAAGATDNNNNAATLGMAHNRSGSSGVANAFLAAIQHNPALQQQQRSSLYVVPEAIHHHHQQSDYGSEAESVSMLSSTSDPIGNDAPSPKSGRTNPTLAMHKKILWLEQRAMTPAVARATGTTTMTYDSSAIVKQPLKATPEKAVAVTTVALSSRPSSSSAVFQLPNNVSNHELERLVDERVKIKVAEVERKLEERLRLYVQELHNNNHSGNSNHPRVHRGRSLHS
jgi:hypothetical protein